MEYENSSDSSSILSDIQTFVLPEEESRSEPKKLLNISFSGGGFKGCAFIGCIKAIYEHDLTKNIQAVAGTSAGALVATLFAAGCDYQYMKTCLSGVLRLFDRHRISWYSIVQNARNLTDQFGVHDTDEIRAYFLECLNNATNTTTDLTFQELYEITGIKLMISATCLDNQTAFYFSHEATKDTCVSEALCISVNIPLLFTTKKFENKTLVDGCVVENLPMKCWPPEEIPNTIAFLVKSKNEIYNDDSKTQIDNVYDYMQKLILAMKKESDAWYYEKYKDTIILIMASNIEAYKKVPSKSDINTVMHSAYFQTVKALQQRGFIDNNGAADGGFISSLIIAEEGIESEDEEAKVSNLKVAKQMLASVTLFILILLIIKLLKRL